MTEAKVEPKTEKRAKAQAKYHVLKLVELFRDMGEEGEQKLVKAWVHLTDKPIQAPNRKQAIKAMVDQEPTTEQGGTYRAIPAEQVQDLTLTVKQTTVHDFT